MAASITARLRLWGGADSGRMTPIACQGMNCAGSFLPSWSSEKARKSGLLSDLKMKIRNGSVFADALGGLGFAVGISWLFARVGNEALTLRLLTRELAHAADRLGLFPVFA